MFGLNSLTSAAMFNGFWLSFRIASAFARDSVTEVDKAAQTTSPKDAANWNCQVVQPAFALDELVLETVSSCYGPGFVAFVLSCVMLRFINFIALDFTFMQQRPCSRVCAEEAIRPCRYVRRTFPAADCDGTGNSLDVLQEADERAQPSSYCVRRGLFHAHHVPQGNAR